MWLIKDDFRGIGTSWRVGDALRCIAVAWLRENVASFGDRVIDEAEAVDIELGAEEARGLGFVEADDELVALHVEADDDEELVVGVGGHADPAALTERVAV